MKGLVYVLVIGAIASLAVGVVSRVMLEPLLFGLEANAFMSFANTCLLFAITLILAQMLKLKE